MGDIFSVKAIKPNYLQVDKVRLELLNALRKEGRLQSRELQSTVENWDGEKPSFDFLIGLTNTEASLLVGPVGSQKAVQKWQWINDGTPPHTITAWRVPLLRFKSGFRSGSKRGTLKTTRSRYFGSWVSKRSVNHPGIKARNWSITLYKERLIPYRTNMNKALAVGLKKGGW